MTYAWIAAGIVAWLACGIALYAFHQWFYRKRGTQWTRGYRAIGLLQAITGPLSALPIAVGLIITFWSSEYWDKPAKW